MLGLGLQRSVAFVLTSIALRVTPLSSSTLPFDRFHRPLLVLAFASLWPHCLLLPSTIPHIQCAQHATAFPLLYRDYKMKRPHAVSEDKAAAKVQPKKPDIGP
jgi:hypothetical protein